MPESESKPTQRRPLRRGVQGLAVIVLLVTVGFWLKTGAHTGFSKNRVEIAKVDPVTEIEYVDYEDRFVMGVEYLAAGAIAGLGLFCLSFAFARKP